MNSEVPPIPESDNSNSKQNDSLDLSLDELKVESTSDFDDAWLEDDIDDVVNVTIEPEESQSSESEVTSSTIIEPDSAEKNEVIEFTDLEISSEKELSEQETELIQQPVANALEQDSEEADEPVVKTAAVEDSETLEKPAVEPLPEPELFVDSWLDEPESDLSATTTTENASAVTQDEEINNLKEQKAALQSEIAALKTQKEQMLLQQVRDVQENMARMVEEGAKELRERKTALKIEIEKLERRKDRINQEMRANFAGSSQELAVKVQGFKEYLVGSLQDLARAADKLDLAKNEASTYRNSSRVRRDEEGMSRGDRNRDRDRGRTRDFGSRTSRETLDPRSSGYRNDRDARSGRDGSRVSRDRGAVPSASQSQFSESAFADQSKRIRQLIDKYSNNPDYYGSPWQLRRTFEPIHAKKVQDWFFVQGGRGAVDSMGSRLQNILVASAAVSILHNLYGDRCRVLVLTDTPENLGEWRRGLQDCLGISRSNFGTNRGVTLFDSPEIAVQRAERLIEEKLLPVIIIDETEELLNLSVLKFPLWLAFASSNKQASSNYLY